MSKEYNCQTLYSEKEIIIYIHDTNFKYLFV